MAKAESAPKSGPIPVTVWNLIAPYLPPKAVTPLRFVARALGVDNQTAQRLLNQS